MDCRHLTGKTYEISLNIGFNPVQSSTKTRLMCVLRKVDVGRVFLVSLHMVNMSRVEYRSTFHRSADREKVVIYACLVFSQNSLQLSYRPAGRYRLTLLWLLNAHTDAFNEVEAAQKWLQYMFNQQTRRLLDLWY